MKPRSAEEELVLRSIVTKTLRLFQNHRAKHGGKMTLGGAWRFLEDPYTAITPHLVIASCVQVGKRLADDEPVLTPTGWVNIGDISVGDEVFDGMGMPTKVINVSHFNDVDLYKMGFSNGLYSVSCLGHLWEYQEHNSNDLKVNTLKDIIDENGYKAIGIENKNWYQDRRGSKVRMFYSPGVQHERKYTHVDPYVVGCLLGDGSLTQKGVRFTSKDEEIINKIGNRLPYPYTITQSKKRNTEYTIAGNRKGYFWKELDKIGIFGLGSDNKRIPDEYKYNSKKVRLEVLRGLMDTDGTISKDGIPRFTSISKKLCDDLRDIVVSLGGYCSQIDIKEKTFYRDKNGDKVYCKPAYRFSFRLEDNPFHLTIKKDKVSFNKNSSWWPSKGYRGTESFYANLDTVEYSHTGKATCITVESDLGTFITRDGLITHNSELQVLRTLATAWEGLQAFCVLPKDSAREKFVLNRVDPALNTTHKFLKDMAREQGRKSNSLGMKHIGNGTVRYVGSNVKADFHEFPSDCLIVDEHDLCNLEHLKYGLDRMEASPWGFQIYMGNPTFHQGEEDPFPRIIDRYEASDRRQWCVPCEDCGKYTPINWEAMCREKIDKNTGATEGWEVRDITWNVEMRRDPALFCNHCGSSRINRLHPEAKWIVRNPNFDRPVGFRISKMFVPFGSSKTLRKLWKMYLACSGNATALTRFFNQILGRAFLGVGMKLSEEHLLALEKDYCLEQYPVPGYSKVERSHGLTTAGIDVSGTEFQVYISDTPHRGIERLIYVGTVSTERELKKLLYRWNVTSATIDAGPEVRTAKKLQAEFSHSMYRCQFRVVEGGIYEAIHNHKNGIVKIDRTELLDEAAARILNKKIWFPQGSKYLDNGQFYKQMLALQRTTEVNSRGDVRMVWAGSNNNHYRLAHAYNIIARELGSYIVGNISLDML